MVPPSSPGDAPRAARRPSKDPKGPKGLPKGPKRLPWLLTSPPKLSLMPPRGPPYCEKAIKPNGFSMILFRTLCCKSARRNSFGDPKRLPGTLHGPLRTPQGPPKTPPGPPKAPRGTPKEPPMASQGPPVRPQGPPKGTKRPPETPLGVPKSTPGPPEALPGAQGTPQRAFLGPPSCSAEHFYNTKSGTIDKNTQKQTKSVKFKSMPQIASKSQHQQSQAANLCQQLAKAIISCQHLS